ncbi:ATP-dependent helicase [Paenibacillus sp. FSL E2-0230]|uniref:ATP-dependent helicase n=1 Tax=Paenibacillus sp. FSL E2-0230 TaxID=2954727 RepID=UPI0030CD1C9B
MLNINVSDWIPSDGMVLEPPAAIAVKSETNSLILAGPGAGKTELLAQRACFLLQTNLCPFPQKILAISFKKDAADNIKERVELRCGKELASRFESRTFDSFAKQLLDRFRLGIPEAYRPKKNYNIVNAKNELRDIVKECISERHPNQPNWKNEINFNVLFARLESDELPILDVGQDIYTWILSRFWDVMTHGTRELGSTLTFQMISKLANYMLKENPLIKKAIQMTYSHVFLDEFQDTTYLQYELVKTIFIGSTTVLTSVGDDKQRIMGWAGALPNSSEQFIDDFNATKIELIRNHRSAPRLIDIQNVIAKVINENAIDVAVSDQHSDLEGVCEVWNFQSHLQEASFIASNLAARIRQGEIVPRDICILVKQQEHIYAKAVIEELRRCGIYARIEKEYQDLITEECIQLIIDFLNMAILEQSHEQWGKISEILVFIQGFDKDQDHLKILKLETELSAYVYQIKQEINQILCDEIHCKESLKRIISSIFNFIGLEKYFRLFPKYASGTYFNVLLENATEKLTVAFLNHSNWSDAISDFLGLLSIPVMTIHKSKGLEYDTVIFLGLEDDAFWSFRNQRIADMCAFFVALSRAKKHCYFTFSESREVLNFGNIQLRTQSSYNISSLYQTLQVANVQVRNITGVIRS